MNFLVIGKSPKAYFLASKLSIEGHLVYLCIQKLDGDYKYDKVIFYDYSNHIEILKFILKKEINLVIFVENNKLTYELGDFLKINEVNVFRIQKELMNISSDLYNQKIFFEELNIPTINSVFFEKETPAFNFLKNINYPIKITAGNDEKQYIVSGFLNSRKCIIDMFNAQYKNILIEENYSGNEIFLYFINDGVSLYLIGEVFEDLEKNQIISPIPFLNSYTKEKIINDIIIKIAQPLNGLSECDYACIFGVKLLICEKDVYVLRILGDILQTHFFNITNLLNEKISDLIISSYNCSLSDDFCEIKFKNRFSLTYICQSNKYEVEYLNNEYKYFKIGNESYINMEGSSLAWLKNYVIKNLV